MGSTLSRQGTLEDPVAFKQLIERGVMPMAPNMPLCVEIIHDTYAFAQWLQPLESVWKGHTSHRWTKKRGEEAVRVFRFLRRESMMLDEQPHLADIETAFPDDPAHPRDVILLVKANISSDHYEGAPQVCLPWARLQRLPAFPPAAFGHHEIPKHMRGQFLKTAKAIEKPPWNLQRAAVYLRKLMADDSPVSLPDISWVNNADRPHAPAAPTFRLPEDETLAAPKPAQRVHVGPGTRAVRGPGEADAEGAAPPAEQERERKLPAMKRPAAENRPRHADGRPKRIKPADLPELPAGVTLGCSTCRFLKCGCPKCRARANIHWDAGVGRYVLKPGEG